LKKYETVKESFRISDKLKLYELKRIIYDNWKDFELNKFKFYDFNGEIIDKAFDFSPVRKVLEQFIGNEFVEKQYDTEAVLRNKFYIGDD
jgi:hypothetical protein